MKKDAFFRKLYYVQTIFVFLMLSKTRGLLKVGEKNIRNDVMLCEIFTVFPKLLTTWDPSSPHSYLSALVAQLEVYS
ncbi:hypothetical protein BC008_37170 [Mastigocoleus testarum BC008]|uniref:Uncharacterized protein n=1 Tax=Mastigocoleus testarum BC008 TaxID=371196 RepID=A0A0V7ZCP7_9CYAN|nr:hypothetical protein BC008_37170 [Mastigocoleus testarum BC008]